MLAALLLAGCARQETAPPAAPPVVAVTTVAPAALALADDLPGRVVPVRVAEIRAQVGGIVRKRLFEQGAGVRAGQSLFQIDAAPFQADADMAAAALRRAEATLARTRVQQVRLAPLVEADAISRQAYDDAVAQRDEAAADVAQARATLARRRLDLRFATVEAPIAGRIEQALVTEGALVAPADATPMARIQQIDKVYVDVRRPAGAGALRGTAGTSVPVAILRHDGMPYAATGRLLFSGTTVDPGTGELLLRVEVDNAGGELLPGMFVLARVPRASYPAALTVPQQAAVRVDGKPHLWTLDASNHAHLVAVELGDLTERRYHVRTGLRAGQKVVVEGMERLTEGVAVAARDWPPVRPVAAR